MRPRAASARGRVGRQCWASGQFRPRNGPPGPMTRPRGPPQCLHVFRVITGSSYPVRRNLTGPRRISGPRPRSSATSRSSSWTRVSSSLDATATVSIVPCMIIMPRPRVGSEPGARQDPAVLDRDPKRIGLVLQREPDRSLASTVSVFDCVVAGFGDREDGVALVLLADATAGQPLLESRAHDSQHRRLGRDLMLIVAGASST